MMCPRGISVVNQKGGVGKTTTAVNLAVCLAQLGHRTLLVDLDPQANASHFLGFVTKLDEPTLYTTADLLLGRRPFEPIRDVCKSGLDLVPSTDALASIELELLTSYGGDRRLADALRGVNAYDFVIADCAPALGMLSLNAMIACPEVLIPIRLEPASLPGALRLQANIDTLRRRSQPDLRILGVLGTFHKETGAMAREAWSSVSGIFRDLVFKTRIHQSNSVGRAAGNGVPVVLSAPRRRESAEYELLTQEVIERGNRQG